MKTVSPVQEFRDKPSKTNKVQEKRICQHSDCKTVLSIYNFDNYCSLHYRLYVDLKSVI